MLKTINHHIITLNTTYQLFFMQISVPVPKYSLMLNKNKLLVVYEQFAGKKSVFLTTVFE